jgi:hypothetical protein
MNRARTARNCRTSLVSARVRRNAMTEKFNKDWDELRRYATIEKDLGKLLQLNAEIDKGKLLVESVSKEQR